MRRQIKSVRFPESVWQFAESQAESQNISTSRWLENLVLREKSLQSLVVRGIESVDHPYLRQVQINQQVRGV